jgi:hypothetical protein
MIFCVVNRMSSPSDCHGVSYTTFHLPLADAPFIPVHRTGFSGAISIKSGHLSIYRQNVFISASGARTING